jgi:RecB family exonuclease
MLKIIEITSPKNSFEIFKNQDLQQKTWIVSDLKSKFLYQNILLHKINCLEDFMIMRASELWHHLLWTVRSDLIVTPKNFMEILLKEKIYDEGLADLTPKALRKTMGEFESFLPFLMQENFEELSQDFFENNAEIGEKWKVKIQKYQEIFKEIQSLGIICPTWIPSFLQKETGYEFQWTRPLVFDLGAQLTFIEAELIHALSRFLDVEVIKPKYLNEKQQAVELAPYKRLEELSRSLLKKESYTSEIPQLGVQKSFYKFSSELAEIKQAVSQIRDWLGQGFAPHELAIVAVDMEYYWPVLSSYLKVEGIPLQKDELIKVQTLPFFSKWLSQLRIVAENINFSDLEVAVFQSYFSLNSFETQFEKIKAQFFNIIEFKDLERSSNISDYFNLSIDKKSKIDVLEFLKIAFNFCDFEMSPSNLDSVIAKFIQSIKNAPELTFYGWVTYLEAILAQQEVTIQKGVSQGLGLCNLMSGEVAFFKKRVYLGLSEAHFQFSKNAYVSPDEFFIFEKDLGLRLENPEQNPLEFEVQWLSSISQGDVFLFGVANFEGSDQSPSIYFLENYLKQSPDHSVCIPALTRWDHIQNLSVEDIVKNRELKNNYFATEIQNQILKKSESKIDRTQIIAPLNLSASKIESYLKCPFMYAAQNDFKLSDPSILDFDIEKRDSGRIFHALFEGLFANGQVLDLNEEQLADLADKTLEKAQIKFLLNHSQQKLKNQLLETGKRFIQTEKIREQTLPERKVSGMEVKIEFYFNFESQEFYRLRKSEDDIQFRGSIDRIDTNSQGHAIVLDYKSSKSQAQQYTKWIADLKIQLLFYAWVLEKGFATEVQVSEIHGALYYTYKDMQSKHGFRFKEASPQFVDFKDKSRNLVTGEEKQNLFKDLENILLATISKIKAGDISALPADTEKSCEFCKWGRLCRAPHLN